MTETQDTHEEKPPEERPPSNLWTFLGALLLARREGDQKHQKAVRNVRWLLTTGFGAFFAWQMFTWVTGFVERVQASAERRDAAIITAIGASADRLEELAAKTGLLATEVVSLKSLAAGRYRCPVCPSCPPCPPPAAVIIEQTRPREEAPRAGPPPPPPPVRPRGSR